MRAHLVQVETLQSQIGLMGCPIAQTSYAVLSLQAYSPSDLLLKGV